MSSRKHATETKDSAPRRGAAHHVAGCGRTLPSLQPNPLQPATAQLRSTEGLGSSFGTAPIQRVKWKYTGSGFELMDTLSKKDIKDGKGTPPSFTPGKKFIGQVYDTTTSEWEAGPVETEEEEVQSIPIGSNEYIGGGANDSHIHRYGNSFHLKLGSSRYNLVQDGEVYEGKIAEAKLALGAITGKRAAWARGMIVAIDTLLSS